MSACCVFGCKNRHSSTSKLKFYRIPSGSRPFQANRRRLWLRAIQRVNGRTDGLKGYARICGAHFISQEASMDHDSPDFVPSVFTRTELNPMQKKARRSHQCHVYSYRKRRRRKASVDTQPGVDSPVDLHSSVLMEEIHTPSTPSVAKEGETLNQETETETTPIKSPTASSPCKTPLSLKPDLGETSPIVLLKRVYVPASGYQCDECNQNFLNTPQLIKHKLLHEGKLSFICENCGKHFTSQADLSEHRCDPEPSFPCNMCDRSFPTSHNLKRHKLRHVRDGRKCSTCGVLFCQRHHHVLFLPSAESVTKYEGDVSTTVEPQHVDGDSMPEAHLLEKPEPSQTADLDDDAQTPVTVSAGPLSKTSSPAVHTGILSETPDLVFLKPPPVSRLPDRVHKISRNRGTSSQFKQPRPKYPATFVKPLLHHPHLPPSLKLFSPNYLTSALLEVKRNYEYILSKPRDVKRNIVKEEPCELPLISPIEQNVEDIKQEITAYDLEIVL